MHPTSIKNLQKLAEKLRHHAANLEIYAPEPWLDNPPLPDYPWANLRDKAIDALQAEGIDRLANDLSSLVSDVAGHCEINNRTGDMYAEERARDLLITTAERLEAVATALGPDQTSRIEPLAVGVDQAAALLDISPRKLGEMTASGEIPSRKAGTRVLYSVDALRAWLQGSKRRKT